MKDDRPPRMGSRERHRLSIFVPASENAAFSMHGARPALVDCPFYLGEQSRFLFSSFLLRRAIQ